MTYNDTPGTAPAGAARRTIGGRTLLKTLGVGFSLLLTAALWVAFAPPALGGQLTMLVVNGNSMEPGMHRGDIAFVSNDGRPSVGDVAAYRSPELGVVIHRVIGDDGSRLTFQGDNRTTVDPYRPAYNEVVGGLSFTVPNGITYLQYAANPKVVIAITLVTMLAGAASSKRIRRGMRRVRRPIGTPAATHGLEVFAFSHPTGSQIATAAAIAIVGAAGLLMLVERQGYTTPSSTAVAFAEHGELNYSGDAPVGLYDGNRIVAPQPIIRGATRSVDIGYDYQLAEGDGHVAPKNVAGTYSLVAQLRHETGWQREITLRAETPFTGNLHGTGTLSMDQVNALASQMEQALKIQEGLTTYTLRVFAKVHATGTTAGVPFERDVEQTMQFSMNNRVMSLDSTVGKTALSLDEKPTVKVTGETERHLVVPMTGLSFEYRELPQAAAIAIGVSTLVLVLGAVSTLMLSRMGEADRIRVRYANQMVDVAEGSPVPESAVFVKRFQDLQTVAAAEGTTIGHMLDGDIHVYFVRAMSETYVYWIVPAVVTAHEAERVEA